jgi:hypothetical protein
LAAAGIQAFKAGGGVIMAPRPLAVRPIDRAPGFTAQSLRHCNGRNISRHFRALATSVALTRHAWPILRSALDATE